MCDAPNCKNLAAGAADSLAPGQRAILVVFASTLRNPTGSHALEVLDEIRRTTGRRPLVLVGVFGGYRVPEDWVGFSGVPADRFDGIMGFTFVRNEYFKEWRNGAPSAAQILGSD